VFLSEHHLSQLPQRVHSNAAWMTAGVISSFPWSRPSIVLFLPFMHSVLILSV
jgi:hypothetical protein